MPFALEFKDGNEIIVLTNALEHLAEELDEDDEDQSVIARLIGRLEDDGRVR